MEDSVLLTALLRLLLARQARPFALRPPTGAFAPPQQAGLYLHIPFCRRLCGFCPYNRQSYDPRLAARCAAALKRELASIASWSPGLQVSSVYIGGGSPATMLSEVASLLGQARGHFGALGPVGVELHPADVNDATLDALVEAGVTMVSIGVQSFQPELAARLGRPADGAAAVRLAAARAFAAVDVDLIFAIPGQTPAQLTADFMQAAELGATQVSAYPLLGFSYTEFGAPGALPSEGTRRRLLEGLIGTASEAGWERTSIWTFARPGTPRYSSVTRDAFVGLGPGAASLHGHVFRLNSFDVDAYCGRLEAGGDPTALAATLSPRARALYHLFWECYNLEIGTERYRHVTGRDLEADFGLELRLGRLLGLLRPKPGGYALTHSGAYLFHRLEQAYTHSYLDKTWGACRHEAWPAAVNLW